MITKFYLPDINPPKLEIPFISLRAATGSTQQSSSYLVGKKDLNDLLISDLAATYMVQVAGDSMEGAGIGSGDILVVDRGCTPVHGDIVLAIVDGGFAVRRLHKQDSRIALIPDNPVYADIELRNEHELQVWGVVTSCVRRSL